MGFVRLSGMLGLVGVTLLAQSGEPKLTAADQWKQGHSHQGDAFDTGPRTKPVKMNDIGYAHFPITTANPEVQMWFDQGMTLLHSFWDYEAERSFRWCLKLEPDNAMAYWGLARAASDSERSREFLAEAVKRKDKVTERERLYIEALEALDQIDSLRDRGPTYRQRNDDYRQVLETLCVKYPDDMEARALLALATMGESRYGTEADGARDPRGPARPSGRAPLPHPQLEPARAGTGAGELPSATARSPPASATRSTCPATSTRPSGCGTKRPSAWTRPPGREIRRMHEQLVFPFNYWNYGHNRNYLSLHPGTARDGGGVDDRRPAVGGGAARPEVQCRRHVQQPHPGSARAAART